MYQLWIDVWTGRAWTVEKYNRPYDTLADAETAVKYAEVVNNEFAGMLTIRQENV